MIKTLGRSVRQFKASSAATAALSALEVVFEIVVPLTMSRLIDHGVYAGSMGQVWKYGLILLLLASMQLTTGMLAAKLGAKASVGLAANLRQDMYDRVQTFSFSNIDKFSAASIVTRLTTDVSNVQNAYQMLLRMAIRAPFMMVFAMIASFSISRQISMVFLAAIPLLALVLALIIRAVIPVFKKVFSDYDGLNKVVQENVRGIRVVKSFNQENFEIKKFENMSAKIFRGFAKGERLIALNMPIMQIFMYTCMLLVSWLGARAIIASGNNEALGLTTGQLTALFSYSMQILMSLMMLSMVFAMITIASSSAERITEILNEKSDITDPADPVYEVKDGAVVFDRVSFVYHADADKKVLDNIDLRIASGETVGIIGSIGSSKSSLVQLIPRLYDVTEGSVSVGGVDVRRYHLDTLRGAVAMVLQKNELFSGTIKENLRWGNENASDEELVQACRLACADDFIRSFPQGYDTYIEQGGTNVSGGQKQRLCIARAAVSDPPVMILDEATSSIDTRTEALVQDGMDKLMQGRTVFVIAHRLSTVQNSDVIMVLDQGRIIERGNHEKLIAQKGVYYQLYTGAFELE